MWSRPDANPSAESAGVPAARRLHESRLEFLQHAPQAAVQAIEGLGPDRGGDAAVIRLGHSPGDAGDRVGIAAEGDGQPDRVLVVRRLQEGDQRLGDAPLARDVEAVSRPDILDPPAQVVAELPLDVVADLVLAAPGPREVDGRRRRLRPLDPLGVVVRDLRRPPRPPD